ncbi:MAG: hypothetical protein K5931_00165, partial [Lachnospiraceae bacterium]|nr:hypothetical protein [Lachnospiraceae bacterium]
MYRLFKDHEIRKTRELSEDFWFFYTMDGAADTKKKKVMVPSSWQTYPDTLTYTGKGIYEKEVFCKGNIRFVFKGVAHTADVYFDG